MYRVLPALVAAAALLTGGCGYTGDPLPPLANIPTRVLDLAAIQRGDRIMVQFTVPPRTTEGVAIKTPLKLDLRIGTAEPPFSQEGWAARATPVPEAPVANGVARYEIQAAAWTNKEATLAVRVLSARGKTVGWSNFVNLPVVAPPERPAEVHAEATAEGVRLTWRARGDSFRIYRRTGSDHFAPVANVQQPSWTDSGAEFGKHYIYQVQTIVKLPNNTEAESDPSEEAGITPEDRFPPAVPAGLNAATAPNSIEISWEGNTEPDLGGYHVYRSTGAGPFEKIGEMVAVPSYSDRGVEHGKTYRYAVSAIDKSGNESARSGPVEATLQ
jgi:fibronectin type 3 domain-containing protein